MGLTFASSETAKEICFLAMDLAVCMASSSSVGNAYAYLPPLSDEVDFSVVICLNSP